MRHSLEGTDRLLELLALRDVRAGQIQRALTDSDGFYGRARKRAQWLQGFQGWPREQRRELSEHIFK